MLCDDGGSQRLSFLAGKTDKHLYIDDKQNIYAHEHEKYSNIT